MGTAFATFLVTTSLNLSRICNNKVVRHLVKAAILEAEKGTKGGVRLLLPADKITLLAVVEACQRTIIPDYCRSVRPLVSFCGFHQAAAELHNAITGVLEKWTLADLLQKPSGIGAGAGGVSCIMAEALQGMRSSADSPLVDLVKSALEDLPSLAAFIHQPASLGKVLRDSCRSGSHKKRLGDARKTGCVGGVRILSQFPHRTGGLRGCPLRKRKRLKSNLSKFSTIPTRSPAPVDD